MGMRERFDGRSRTVAAVGHARALVAEAVEALGLHDLADEAAVVTSELVTNAVLHGDGVVEVTVAPLDDGVRISVEDRTRVPPVMGLATSEAMTGRGLLLVSSMAARWGAEVRGTGKVVWAELVRGHVPVERTEEQLLDLWDDPGWREEPTAGGARYRILLGEVPTSLLLEAKTHVDNLVRELTLAVSGAETGTTGPLPPHIASLVEAVVSGFADARQAIKRQAVEAARRGDPRVALELFLPADAADAGLAFLDALDQADAYSRAARLLTLETPPQHRLFRQWYIGELVRQLQAVTAGQRPPQGESFDDRLLRELDSIAEAQRISERGARLYEVAAALSRAVTPDDVAAAVLKQGVDALGASGGGLVFLNQGGVLREPATLGYDETVVAGLRAESPDADLPAAQALRTGESVWLESRDERDTRFPALVGLERDTVSLCAVPLVVGGRRLGALRFSFSSARLFDDQERRFVVALAAQTAQALDRAQLHEQRLDTSHRLQRSLLPGRMPAIPGADLAGIYHPLGDGMELGGDFYDVWQLPDGRFAFAIGDSSGTGPEAAAQSAMARFTLRALLTAGVEPADALEQLNGALLEAGDGDPFAERFCTAAIGVVTPGDRLRVAISSGGHPFPLLRRASAPTGEVEVGGSLLGLLEDPEVATRVVDLEPGDLVVLVTDGATEARRRGAMLGVEGVCAAIDAAGDGAEEVAAAIEDAVLEHTGGALTDDLAALVLRAT